MLHVLRHLIERFDGAARSRHLDLEERRSDDGRSRTDRVHALLSHLGEDRVAEARRLLHPVLVEG